MVGLIVAGPWLTMVGSRVMARRTSRPSVLIAGRRMSDNPRGAFRADQRSDPRPVRRQRVGRDHRHDPRRSRNRRRRHRLPARRCRAVRAPRERRSASRSGVPDARVRSATTSHGAPLDPATFAASRLCHAGDARGRRKRPDPGFVRGARGHPGRRSLRAGSCRSPPLPGTSTMRRRARRTLATKSVARRCHLGRAVGSASGAGDRRPVDRIDRGHRSRRAPMIEVAIARRADARNARRDQRQTNRSVDRAATADQHRDRRQPGHRRLQPGRQRDRRRERPQTALQPACGSPAFPSASCAASWSLETAVPAPDRRRALGRHGLPGRRPVPQVAARRITPTAGCSTTTSSSSSGLVACLGIIAVDPSAHRAHHRSRGRAQRIAKPSRMSHPAHIRHDAGSLRVATANSTCGGVMPRGRNDGVVTIAGERSTPTNVHRPARRGVRRLTAVLAAALLLGTTGPLIARSAPTTPGLTAGDSVDLRVLLIGGVGGAASDPTTAAWAAGLSSQGVAYTEVDGIGTLGAETITLPTLDVVGDARPVQRRGVRRQARRLRRRPVHDLFAYESTFGIRQLDGNFVPAGRNPRVDRADGRRPEHRCRHLHDRARPCAHTRRARDVRRVGRSGADRHRHLRCTRRRAFPAPYRRDRDPVAHRRGRQRADRRVPAPHAAQAPTDPKPTWPS